MIRQLSFVLLIGGLELVLITNMANAGGAKKDFDIRTEAGTVLIAADQILAYDWATHTVTLKPGVRKELLGKLKRVLANGQSFIAAVGGKKVYQGTLTSLLSSASFATPVIVLDEAAFLPNSLKADQIRIGLGYPGKTVFKGEDPRGDPVIEASLKASGKLALSPAAYLKLLQERLKDTPSYCPGRDGPVVTPVNEHDIPGLIKLLDSEERCAATMLRGSAVYSEKGSTVGHEAAVLIDSFRLGKGYPIANTSTEHRVDREALLKWWTGLDKKAKQP
jgi:hypothetical protein